MSTPSRFAEAQSVLLDADCLFDASAVNAAYDRISRAIRVEYATLNPVVLCVMIGGLIPTVEIIKRLNFPFELDYLHATRYRGETTGSQLVWKVEPSTVLTDRHVLIIDDILDEGHTLLAIQRAVLAQSPASLKTAVLSEKRHGRKALAWPPSLSACRCLIATCSAAAWTTRNIFANCRAFMRLARRAVTHDSHPGPHRRHRHQPLAGS